MQDEEVILANACSDLVSLKKLEAFPLNLLRDHCQGEWIGVRELCLQLGLAVSEIKAELFATWLPDPMANESYVVILFYDDESKWSSAAHFNRQRLQRIVAPKGGLSRSGTAALPVPDSASLKSTPPVTGGRP